MKSINDHTIALRQAIMIEKIIVTHGMKTSTEAKCSMNPRENDHNDTQVLRRWQLVSLSQHGWKFAICRSKTKTFYCNCDQYIRPVFLPHNEQTWLLLKENFITCKEPPTMCLVCHLVPVISCGCFWMEIEVVKKVVDAKVDRVSRFTMNRHQYMLLADLKTLLR